MHDIPSGTVYKGKKWVDAKGLRLAEMSHKTHCQRKLQQHVWRDKEQEEMRHLNICIWRRRRLLRRKKVLRCVFEAAPRGQIGSTQHAKEPQHRHGILSEVRSLIEQIETH